MRDGRHSGRVKRLQRWRGDGAKLAQIQITPLVDVLLVLWVLGAMAMGGKAASPPTAAIPDVPAPRQAIPLELPLLTSSAASPLAGEDADPLIALAGHGRLFWHEQPVTSDILRQRLQAALAQRPQQSVQLAVDASVTYADLIRWLDWLQGQGASQIRLLTRSDAGAGQPR